MKQPRRLKPSADQRRKDILQAALECFLEKGVSATTMEDIRTRSKASTGSIYHHYSSKEDLAGALYVEGLRNYEEGLLDELRNLKTAEECIHTIVRHHLDWVDGNPEWARYLTYNRKTQPVGAIESQIWQIHCMFFSTLRDVLKPYFDSGELLDMPFELFIALVVGPGEEYSRQLLKGTIRIDPAIARAVLTRGAWQAVQGEKKN